MNRILIALTTAVTAVGLGLIAPVEYTQAQQGTTAEKQSWFHLSEVVAQPEGCNASAGAKGLITFSTANGRARAHYMALPAKNASRSKSAKLSAGEAALTEPIALLSAFIVRADGSPDPAFGSRPRDMVILTTGDGRVILAFSDFSADFEAGTYAYPARISGPVSRLTDAQR